MADIGLQPCYNLQVFQTADYNDEKIDQGVIAGMTVVVTGNIETLPYIGTPFDRGLVSREMTGVFPKSVDDTIVKQIWT